MKYQSSDKKIVQLLINQCVSFGVKHVIISPGSRNAPLIISFDNHPQFTCYSIPDERSAGFYALGMARELNEPVAIVCTSGTAVLNYAPALTEAYYQEMPIIAITADRPSELIDQEDGQTIRQHNIFANHIRYSTTLPLYEDAKSLEQADIEIKQAFNAVLSTVNGPVHINIPFNEPLYNTEYIIVNTSCIKVKEESLGISVTDSKKLKTLAKIVNTTKRIMLLSGVLYPDKDINRVVNLLANEKAILVVAPATANLYGDKIINTPDLLIKTLSKKDVVDFNPELLITIGGPVVSKVTKQLLRDNKNLIHYDIDENPTEVNAYQSLSSKIDCKPYNALNYIYNSIEPADIEFQNMWVERNKEVNALFNRFIDNEKWCDIGAFSTLFKAINTPVNLHLANSTPVRYAELFSKHKNTNYYCNRGTSGIDGSLSTASGSALTSDKITVLITGDMSFVYDSNVFWNRHIPSNLRIILVNNGGGNIFKIIPGPKTTNQLNDFFQSPQNVDNRALCKAYNIGYSSANNFADFSALLNGFFNKDKNCSVLEIFTNADTNEYVFAKLQGVLHTL